jgi:copper oxidase (laccase) domain-containing protein
MATAETQSFPILAPRYEIIEARNIDSSYLNDPNRPFNVYISVATAGKPRVDFDPTQPDLYTSDEIDNIKKYNKVGQTALDGNRFMLAGNMSPINELGPLELSVQQRIENAHHNMSRYISSLGINPGDVCVLRPDRSYDTPMQVVNIDDEIIDPNATEPTIVEGRGDFAYTHNPNVIIGVRPADCPLVIASAETPNGRIYMMVHFAWRGAAAPGNGVADMAKEFEALGVDFNTLDIYITPGAQSESFSFTGYDQHPHRQYPETKKLFTDVTEHANGYSFGIDTPHFVYQGLLDLGIKTEQIYLDTSDTAALESGYSSHTRSVNLQEDNNRDMIIVEFNKNKIRVNPNRAAPPEVLKQITPVEVNYVDFEGNRQTGTIEVNKEVAQDVKDFFELALELGFPIENVVRSSDAEYLWDDDKLMAANTSSGFNYRFIKGTDTPSLHGLGLAFDVNTRCNPYLRYDNVTGELIGIDPIDAEYSIETPGTLHADHPLVMFLKRRGWQWGGDWTPESGRTDYQHFQKSII